MKNVLVLAGSSDIAKSLILRLINAKYRVFATYRKSLPEAEGNFIPLVLDVCSEDDFLSLKETVKGTMFDAVVYFAGVAVSCPVSELKSDDLKKQFDVSVFGLSRLLSCIYPNLDKNSKVINISSMASFGIFPFISPYCAAKAAADILLNSFEIETGINCVSIKPGVVGTKFWEYCADLNKSNFENLPEQYKETGKFLLSNALQNKTGGLTPEDVSKVIFKAIKAKRPKKSYLVGRDAFFASLSRFVPKSVLNRLIRYILKSRVRKFQNEVK